MTPESSVTWAELEFEKHLKQLNKKEFLEFRKTFRTFSTCTQPPATPEEKENFTATLRAIGKKLHLIKKEFERREVIEKTEEKIQELLKSPADALKMDDPNFKQVIYRMTSIDLKHYTESFEKIYKNILQDRKKNLQQNAGLPSYHSQNRDTLKILKRWDLLEEELSDREKRRVQY